MSALVDVRRAVRLVARASVRLHGRKQTGISRPHWNEAALMVDAALPKLAEASRLLEPPFRMTCECGSRRVTTEIEAESQGRGSPPLYRCRACGAQWGRD